MPPMRGPEQVKKPCSATDPLWYKDAIIYELHVRAFADSNADGIGDFQGLISKLDYLQELGVTCLWLLPFFPSPLRDDGYDIADYTSVNPSYGTIEDFQQFLTEAHTRNLQVMIELVINHTSDQHPWFQRARHAPKGSPERDIYVWSDTDKKFEGVRIIFTDTEKSNWTWDEVAQQYYWHRFFAHQPDLNFDNPRVMEEVLNAMRFWMDMGVDGLRLDAIPYLIERDGTSCENVPETHVLIKHIRAVMDAEYENRLILAEANMWPPDVRPYFGDGDECQMAFHFPLMPRIYMALRQEDRLPITDIMAQTPEIPENCQWGLFLRNHDELTLEMVTDDERDYMNLAYAADSRMRINVGIRRRLAPLVDNSRRRIELLNSLLLSFPGTPIMYYGDEIGMGDNIYLGDRNGVRTPMQWNSDRNAGFSKAVPAKLYFPVIMDPIWGYQAINVEAQQTDPSSLLHWTRNMIALRKLFQVFGRGTLEFLHPENRKVLAYIRDATFPGGDSEAAGHTETVLCVANLSRFAQPATLDLSKFAGRLPVEMLGYVPFPLITEAPYAITLAPYSFFWLELQPAAVRPPAPAIEPATSAPRNGPTPTILSLSTLLRGRGLELLESLLPRYIAQQRWFGSKSRTIRSARILSSIPIGEAAVIALVEVRYEPNGQASIGSELPGLGVAEEPETYQLPLAIARGEQAAALQESRPQAIIATLNSGEHHPGEPPPLLFDASASPEFQAAILQMIAYPGADPAVPSSSVADPDTPSSPPVSSSAKVGTNAGTDVTHPSTATPVLVASRSASFDPQRFVDLPSRLGSAEQSNTSILYDNIAILKLFRRLRPGENPDVEIARFLTDVAHSASIPAYIGDLRRSADDTTFAFLQSFAPNEGDGWAWTLDELGRFYESVAHCPPPHSTGAPPNFIDSDSPSHEITEHAGVYLDAAQLIGRRTAELHLALATPSDNAAFTPQPYTVEDLADDRQRIQRQTIATLNALQAMLQTRPGDLPAETAALAADLLGRRDDLLARLRALHGDPANFGSRIRVHGDYHLGQLLRSRTDFLIVDFEGEPARSLEERRQKQSPLRDVAGMLRSFSYAARAGLDLHLQRHPENHATLEAWSTAWENAAGNAFLRGYRDAGTARSDLLPAPAEAQIMLLALLLEKAMYELLYEMNNRPTWLPIPLQGLLAIAHAS
jgi:maltose alpha-D-glucosyltransferase/alpha-amylase